MEFGCRFREESFGDPKDSHLRWSTLQQGCRKTATSRYRTRRPRCFATEGARRADIGNPTPNAPKQFGCEWI